MYTIKKRAVESERQGDGGTSPQCLLLWMRELVMESCNAGQNQKMGNKGDESSISFPKRRRSDVGKLLYKSSQGSQENMAKDDFIYPFYQKRSLIVWDLSLMKGRIR